jgi:AcrR family transcriptional regulator
MSAVTLQEARAAVVRERVLEGLIDLLASGEDVTFARVARAAGVPERTVYRHFPSRGALMTEVFHWANRRLGLDGTAPGSEAELVAQVTRTFTGFDEIAPVIRELLLSPDGLAARLSDNERRQRVASDVVRAEVPGLDAKTRRRVAATLQLLTSAATWQDLRDYWDMDGDEAGATAALAIDLVLEGARQRAASSRRPARPPRINEER